MWRVCRLNECSILHACMKHIPDIRRLFATQAEHEYEIQIQIVEIQRKNRN